ncbi:signal peptidase I [Omnitrophica bacterium]|nr:signal peptidase I [Candidatus Omnitrophota bacterium]
MAIWLPLLALALIILFRHKIALEWKFFRTQRKAWFHQKWKDWGEPFLVAAILAIIIRTFLLGPYKIPTGSMRPTFMEGDRIFVDKVSYRFHEPERGDIIVFKYPVDKKKDYVKRLIGLPNETLKIQDGKVSVNGELLDQFPFSSNYYYNQNSWEYGKSGQEFTIPEGHYFVLGDNSAHSADSRKWGFVPDENIIGKAIVIWWPPKRVKLVR